MDELLTVEGVARICKVHEGTVRRQIASGKLRSVRVGRSVRVRRQDLDAYLSPAVEEVTDLRNARPFTKDDPFWSVVGSFSDPDGAWVSGNIHRAMAEAHEVASAPVVDRSRLIGPSDAAISSATASRRPAPEARATLTATDPPGALARDQHLLQGPWPR